MSDRGSSIRIPWQVEKDGKGYAEDRRPNANVDPYVVARMITETVCSAFDAPDPKGTRSAAKKKTAAKKK